jgi:hypothetical protein
MAVAIYQRVTKLFQPTWQHHHPMIASITASIIHLQVSFFLGVDQHTKPTHD